MTVRKTRKVLMSYGVQRNQARSIAAGYAAWWRWMEEMKRFRERADDRKE